MRSIVRARLHSARGLARGRETLCDARFPSRSRRLLGRGGARTVARERSEHFGEYARSEPRFFLLPATVGFSRGKARRKRRGRRREREEEKTNERVLLFLSSFLYRASARRSRSFARVRPYDAVVRDLWCILACNSAVREFGNAGRRDEYRADVPFPLFVASAVSNVRTRPDHRRRARARHRDRAAARFRSRAYEFSTGYKAAPRRDSLATEEREERARGRRAGGEERRRGRRRGDTGASRR